jgi:hypothetical protein
MTAPAGHSLEPVIPEQHATTTVNLPASLLPALPWRDPHTVPPGQLSTYIARLEQACVEYPTSAPLRTCLGMAHAMNYDVYASLDALEEARAIDRSDFWAQMKYAELLYRLRTLVRAEQETQRAIELAQSPWQLGIARRQLQEIRRLARDSVRNVTFSKPLGRPALALVLLMVALFGVMLW